MESVKFIVDRKCSPFIAEARKLTVNSPYPVVQDENSFGFRVANGLASSLPLLSAMASGACFAAIPSWTGMALGSALAVTALLYWAKPAPHGQARRRNMHTTGSQY